VGALSPADWKTFRNDCGVAVPSQGLIRIDEVVKNTPDGRLLFKGRKPFACPMWSLWVTAPVVEVAAGKRGSCAQSPIQYVRFDPEDGTPQPGQPWGVKEGGFKLRKGFGGFVVLREPESADDEIVLVQRVEHHVYMGELATDLVAPEDSEEAWEDPPVADVLVYRRSVRANDDEPRLFAPFTALTLKDAVNRDPSMSAATGTMCKVEWIEGEWSFVWMACHQ
jgi:hypothetical protein